MDWWMWLLASVGGLLVIGLPSFIAYKAGKQNGKEMVIDQMSLFVEHNKALEPVIAAAKQKFGALSPANQQVLDTTACETHRRFLHLLEDELKKFD